MGTTIWGYFILPLSGSANVNVESKIVSKREEIFNEEGATAETPVLNKNNQLLTKSPLANLKFGYNTPMVYYTSKKDDGTNDKINYFYFMEYVDSTTVFDGTVDTSCPSKISVDKIYLRNCWDTGLHTSYKEFISTGIRVNFSLWVFVFLLL